MKPTKLDVLTAPMGAEVYEIGLEPLGRDVIPPETVKQRIRLMGDAKDNVCSHVVFIQPLGLYIEASKDIMAILAPSVYEDKTVTGFQRDTHNTPKPNGQQSSNPEGIKYEHILTYKDVITGIASNVVNHVNWGPECVLTVNDLGQQLKDHRHDVRISILDINDELSPHGIIGVDIGDDVVFAHKSNLNNIDVSNLGGGCSNQIRCSWIDMFFKITGNSTLQV